MRQRMVKALNRANLDAVSVENSAYPGTPDVNFLYGWLELKWIEDWPTGEATTARIRHFTPQQRCWLIRRWLAAQKKGDGWAWLLIQIEKRQEWLLFTGEVAALEVGKEGRNRQALYDLANGVFGSAEEVVTYLEKYRSASLN